MKPPVLRQIADFIHDQRGPDSPAFDIVWEGQTPGADPAQAAEIVHPWAEAGATWWIESLWDTPDPSAALTRIQQGPPTV